jgi:hypothetical protein
MHSLDRNATNVGATALFGESGGAYFALGSHPKETKKAPPKRGISSPMAMEGVASTIARPSIRLGANRNTTE